MSSAFGTSLVLSVVLEVNLLDYINSELSRSIELAAPRHTF